jgi:hypothetical protein
MIFLDDKTLEESASELAECALNVLKEDFAMTFSDEEESNILLALQTSYVQGANDRFLSMWKKKREGTLPEGW